MDHEQSVEGLLTVHRQGRRLSGRNDQRLVGAGNLVIKEEVAGQHNQDQVLAGVIPSKTGCRRDHHFVNLHVDVLLVNVFGVVGFRSDQVGRLL